MTGIKELTVGKLPIKHMESILESIPCRGLAVQTRMGMDAAITELRGKKLAICSGVAVGQDTAKFAELVSSIAASIRKSGFVPDVINPIVLLPEGTTLDDARQVILEVSHAAEKLGISVGKGHTEITNSVSDCMVIATIFGSSYTEAKGRSDS